ncbi:cobalt-precorrin 5A hydrolase [Ignavigranum ruoffiae]|uniref:Cobalt-precorrin 5A acetaldehyde-lyase n=1 Tax=Ignavigranum ruoffiae TaxID=89093 RepID=A0A1H9CGL1_9LACT|nr:cobalamin biosynthesis protein [Ignavigranum ruoffiae]SEP99758.1 cobalt-precorrin 5A acetaldehyde-lyase [Ignavigranum ruoffiae]
MNIANNIQKKYSRYSHPNVALVSITRDGQILSEKIKKRVFPQAIIYTKYTNHLNTKEEPLIEDSAIKTIQYLMQNKTDLIITIMASGITVRAIAPCLRDKTIDPAIIVIDDQGHFVISLLSGHLGNANNWAKEIAIKIDSTPVITTATDSKERVGVDELAKYVHGYYTNFKEQTRLFNQLIAEDNNIALINEAEVPLPEQLGKIKNIDKQIWMLNPESYQGTIVISDKFEEIFYQQFNQRVSTPILQLIPRQYVIGVGCRKDIEFPKLLENFKKFMQDQDLSIYAVNKIVSIDIKKNELSIQKLAQKLGVEFETYSKEELIKYENLYPGSSFVKKKVGVSNVAQTAAHHATNSKVLSQRYAYDGSTFAIAKKIKGDE